MARFATANGLRVAYQRWGGDDGPLAVLVHGFPDTPATWRHLGPTLAAAGFRVVAPWTRGYAPTDIPADGDYSTAARAADLNRLHDVLDGEADAVLVGHDWGANASYAAGAAAPDRWARVVTMGLPPDACMHGVATRLGDVARWWYVLVAQLPVQRMLARRRGSDLALLWRQWSPGYEPTDDDLAALRSSLGSRDNVRAALSYYRTALRHMLRGEALRPDGPVPGQPTLYLHGRDDGCIRASYATEARAVLARANAVSRVEVIDGAGHFLHLERPELVNRLVTEWVTARP